MRLLLRPSKSSFVGIGLALVILYFQIGVTRRRSSKTFLNVQLDLLRPLAVTTKHNETNTRPPLSSLIHNNRIVGDVQFLLDFAIVGHSKCGTTTMMHWLREHDDIEMYGHEIRYLVEERPAEFVSLLYNLSEGSYYKRGYKQPNEIVRPKGFRYLQKHWPRTKLIVGVRHPVTWLQSFVSFKIRNGKGDNMKKLLQHYVDGEAIPTTIRYHVHLSQLGMTNATDPLEAVLLGSHAFHVPKMPTQVFLYENSQPFDATDNHHVQFANDMTEFLCLSYPLHPLVREDTKYTDVGVDICEDKYADLRQRLIDEGRKAATWIVEFFLKSPDVTTSNRSHLETRLKTWSSDPCMKG